MSDFKDISSPNLPFTKAPNFGTQGSFNANPHHRFPKKNERQAYIS